MPAWLAHFKLGETLEIVDGDNLIEHPWQELERIQDFLGLEREITKESFTFNKEKGFYCIKPKKDQARNHKYKLLIMSKSFICKNCVYCTGLSMESLKRLSALARGRVTRTIWHPS